MYKKYSVREFTIKFKHLLELRIIQFDHLPENEQRKCGILSENQPYIQKINSVSSMQSLASMILEAKKCQHLCCKCHVQLTKKRRGIGRVPTKNKLMKMNYVNKIKLKTGCEICHYKNNETELFDMDHLVPKNKFKQVSTLAVSYTHLTLPTTPYV